MEALHTIVDHYFDMFDKRFASESAVAKRIDLLSICHIETLPIPLRMILELSANMCEFALDVTYRIANLDNATREMLARAVTDSAKKTFYESIELKIPPFQSQGFFAKGKPDSEITLKSADLDRLVTHVLGTFKQTFQGKELQNRITDKPKLADIFGRGNIVYQKLMQSIQDDSIKQFASTLRRKIPSCYKLNNRDDLVDMIQIYAIAAFNSLVKIPNGGRGRGTGRVVPLPVPKQKPIDKPRQRDYSLDGDIELF
jgi:hypothetical protein